MPLVLEAAPERDEARLAGPLGIDAGDPIRVILGPQDDYFEADSVAAFLQRKFTVSPDMDRMGMRLEGPVLRHAIDYNIVSDGIATGAVQVPGSGKAIVLLADHQTTGGYAKIATVISADPPRLARMKPGARLRLMAVDAPAAERARRLQEERIGEAIGAIEPVATGPVEARRLGAVNLVSGVVDALD